MADVTESRVTHRRWPARLAAAGVAIMLALACHGVLAETRVALVIGNSSYAFSPLTNPKNDAEAVAKTLKAVGFAVTKVIDADQAAMRRAVVEFGRRLRQSDAVGVLYYAGHGVQVSGENFLIPIGVDIKDEAEVAFQSVNLNEVLRTMSAARSRLNIVILDACRDNPFPSSTRGGSRGLAHVVSASGTLVAYATAPGQVALDGDGINSPYSVALARHIPTAGISLEEVFKRTRKQVMEETNSTQIPWESTSLTGDFFFRPKRAEPEVSGKWRSYEGVSEGEVAELAAWERIKESRDPAILKKHLEAYPNGSFAELIRYRLAQGKPVETTSSSDGTGIAGWIGNVFGASQTENREVDTLYEEALKLEARNTPASDVEAVRLYRAAAARGLPAAMYQLARAYDRGRGVEKSVAEAAVWYKRAADLGHVPAMASLGTMYEFGEGVPADLVEALRLYKLAAEAGDAHGMTSVGYLYQTGKGVPKDGEEARKWYEKAAAAGNPRAMYNLALMHLRGEGGERDFGEAVRHLKTAIEKGHAGAMRELAFLFDEGRGVARDPKSAAQFLLASYKAGHKDARMDLLARPEAWSITTRKEIQRQLSAAGIYSGRASGYFDMTTRRAIEAYAAK